MTTEQLIEAVQDYYGLEYSWGMGKVVVKYLEGLGDELKAFLLAETLKSHPATFKNLPDVAIFEKVLGQALENCRAKRPAQAAITGPEEVLATPEEIAAFQAEFPTIFRKWLAGRPA